MNAELVLPAIVAAAVGTVSTSIHRRLRPDVAAHVLVVTMVAVVVAVVPAALTLALGYVAHLTSFGGAMAWCRDAFGLHHRIPAWLGVPALAVLIAGCVQVRRVRRSWRRLRHEHSDGVEVAPSSGLFAYTLPGPGGHIVVSSGLLDQLDDRELTVVMAHEQAHARHRHDRYVMVAAVAVAIVPVLVPLQRRLRFVLERWADESAVDHVDADRERVARTLAKVALSGASAPAGAVGVVGLGVAGRVTALLDPPPAERAGPWIAVGIGGVIAVLASAAVQAHHLLPLLASLCPG